MSNLKPMQVRLIRQLALEGATAKWINSQFPTFSTITIRNIINNKSWRGL